MSISRRLAGLGVVAGLLVGFVGGAGVVSAQHAAPAAAPSTPAPAASAPEVGVAPAVGAPVAVTSNGSTGSGAGAGSTAAGSATSGVAYAQPAIAYPGFPIYAGNPGVAPDHTIVVVGVGQVDLQADGSDRATASRSAIAAAMRDARAQADAVASAGSLTIQGTLSVSVSVSPYWPGPLPMEGGSSGQVAPGAVPISPPTIISPIRPNQATLVASVTVAYRIS